LNLGEKIKYFQGCVGTLTNTFLKQCVSRKQATAAAAGADRDNTDDHNDWYKVCLWFNMASVKHVH